MTSEPGAESRLAEEIPRLVRSLEASGRSLLVRYDQELLQSIVEAAMRIFGAAAASIALVDETRQAMVFKVACGAGRENVAGVSIPLDHGLAGYVVMTGQPISVSDVRGDARFNQDFANRTGYVPRSILATPLLVGERVIGVMEVLDKINAPSFGMQDMDLLGIFARQAAIAIHQSQQYDHLGEALVEGLRRLVEPQDSPALHRLLDSSPEMALDERLLAAAEAYNAISRLGCAEQDACLEILQAFARYSRSKIIRY